MPKVVLVLEEMPSVCWECPCCNAESGFCQKTHKCIYDEPTKSCPLRPWPKRKGDNFGSFAIGWNACLDAIEGMKNDK